MTRWYSHPVLMTHWPGQLAGGHVISTGCKNMYRKLIQAASLSGLFLLLAACCDCETTKSSTGIQYDDSLHQFFCEGDPKGRAERMRSVSQDISDEIRFIDMGESIASSISTSHHLDDDVYGELWMFFVCEERRVVIDMTSVSMDSQIALGRGILKGTSEGLATDDDSGEGFNAKISIRLQPGSYKILATSHPTSESKTGAYVLSIDKR